MLKPSVLCLFQRDRDREESHLFPCWIYSAIKWLSQDGRGRTAKCRVSTWEGGAAAAQRREQFSQHPVSSSCPAIGTQLGSYTTTRVTNS